MPLSLLKLERLFSSKGLLINKYFTMNSLCVYLEVFNLNNAETFLLYIQSKYEINLERGNNVFKIEYLDILDEKGNITGDYAKEPDNHELENNYDEVEINLSPDSNNRKNLEKHMEDNYNHPVSLKDITNDDMHDLRDIFRQLRRFKFCVQNIKYKLVIVYKNYLCCVTRYNTFECFITKQRYIGTDKRLLVSLDLETLYSKIETLSLDIKTVKQGVYKVLNRNHLRNARNLKNILEQNANLSDNSNDFYSKKEQYNSYINNLEEMLEKTEISEKKTLAKIEKINEKYSDSSLKGLHLDIEKSHLMSRQQVELDKIRKIKQEILINISSLKEKQENLMLRVDKIFFDNSVMMDAIIKNINSLDLTKT